LHAEAGSEVTVVILSEGEDAKLPSTERCATRRECSLTCAKELGVGEVLFLDFPDQKLDSVPLYDLIKPIEAAVEKYRPTVVYTHHGGDANSDHLVTFRATYAACRPMTPSGRLVKRLLTFETPSSTDQAPQSGIHLFNPATFVDVEPVWKKKLAALACYPTEMIGGTHPRSYEYIEALARMRGGYAGYRFAEAFVSVRERLGRPAAAYSAPQGEN
jgi:LmbE family N-acetylglucosaminyl deacetylase